MCLFAVKLCLIKLHAQNWGQCSIIPSYEYYKAATNNYFLASIDLTNLFCQIINPKMLNILSWKTVKISNIWKADTSDFWLFSKNYLNNYSKSKLLLINFLSSCNHLFVSCYIRYLYKYIYMCIVGPTTVRVCRLNSCLNVTHIYLFPHSVTVSLTFWSVV